MSKFGVIAAVLLSLVAAGPPVSAQVRDIRLEPITTPIVPTRLQGGDREFGGNGPRITLRVRLRPDRNGNAILADVTMTAVELGGDGSRTSTTRSFRVWSRAASGSPFQVAEIVGLSDQTFTFVSPPGEAPGAARPVLPRGMGFVGFEDGGLVVRLSPPRGIIQSFVVLGDTTGDDISRDQNPHGDTSIRRIDLRPLRIRTR